MLLLAAPSDRDASSPANTAQLGRQGLFFCSEKVCNFLERKLLQVSKPDKFPAFLSKSLESGHEHLRHFRVRQLMLLIVQIRTDHHGFIVIAVVVIQRHRYLSRFAQYFS